MAKGDSRRQAILERLSAAPMVPVAELAGAFNVTMETIRKDLSILEESGLVVRIHGGAALAGDSGVAFPYDLRKTIHKTEKRQIARAACTLIHPGDSILLESSTTTVALCQELLKNEALLNTLTVVTNSLYIAQLFELGALCRRFFFLGGWIVPEERATQGDFTAESLQRFHVDCAFLSSAALGSDLRLSAYYETDMYFQQRAIQSAKKVAVLLDESKFHMTGLFAVSDLAAVDYLVTDIAFSPQDEQILVQKQVQVVRNC